MWPSLCEIAGVRGGGGEGRATGRTQQGHTLLGVLILEVKVAVSGMCLLRSTRPHTELRRGHLPVQRTTALWMLITSKAWASNSALRWVLECACQNS